VVTPAPATWVAMVVALEAAVAAGRRGVDPPPSSSVTTEVDRSSSLTSAGEPKSARLIWEGECRQVGRWRCSAELLPSLDAVAPPSRARSACIRFGAPMKSDFVSRESPQPRRALHLSEDVHGALRRPDWLGQWWLRAIRRRPVLVPSAGCRHRDKGSGAIESLVAYGATTRNVSFGSVTYEPNHGRRTLPRQSLVFPFSGLGDALMHVAAEQAT
jgi:hypothetical protein